MFIALHRISLQYLAFDTRKKEYNLYNRPHNYKKCLEIYVFVLY